MPTAHLLISTIPSLISTSNAIGYFFFAFGHSEEVSVRTPKKKKYPIINYCTFSAQNSRALAQ
jgi:hypothetical protein